MNSQKDKKLSKDTKDTKIIEELLNTYQSGSPKASWIFGGCLLLFLITVVFALPSPTDFQEKIVRFLMALTGALFSLFFLGGVLLKGTLGGLITGATGGFVIFILIQFVYDPFIDSNNISKTVTPQYAVENSVQPFEIQPTESHSLIVSQKYPKKISDPPLKVKATQKSLNSTSIPSSTGMDTSQKITLSNNRVPAVSKDIPPESDDCETYHELWQEALKIGDDKTANQHLKMVKQLCNIKN